MSKRLKDTDYMYISARIRCLENRLLTRERMERMLDARTNEEAVKILSECGYQELEPLTAENLERSLAEAREETFQELAEASPNPQLVDVFRVKYDYHNAKAIIKCAATNQDPRHLLIDAGRVSAGTLLDAFRQGDLSALPQALAGAMEQAQERLLATGDPQKCDFSLDEGYYGELSRLAAEAKSDFLSGYVALMIDTANLKSAVRVMRLGKNEDFLKSVLVSGGRVSPAAIVEAYGQDGKLTELFTGHLQESAQLGAAILKGGRQTAFEKACDNALNNYLRESRMIPFGDGVLVAYAAARENEITAARIILTGRLGGVPTSAIRERLRDAYV